MAFDLAAGYAENPDAFQRFGSTLRRVADPRVYPAVARTVEAGVFDDVGSFEVDNEADSDFGLQLYLDGVAAFIDRVG